MLDSNYQSYMDHMTQDFENLNNSYTNINQHYHNETQNYRYLSNQTITTEASSLRSTRYFYANEDLNNPTSYEHKRSNHGPIHHPQSYQTTSQPTQHHTQSNPNPIHTNSNFNQNINYDINQNLKINNQ